MLAHERKESAFIVKVDSRCFFVDFRSPCWCTKVVHQHGDSIQSSIKLRETFRQITLTQKRCAAQT